MGPTSHDLCRATVMWSLDMFNVGLWLYGCDGLIVLVKGVFPQHVLVLAWFETLFLFWSRVPREYGDPQQERFSVHDDHSCPG